ncbi:MAG: Xaa-Pro peptidase family protein [Oscillospiraceae bacterium]|nr:Xaa-Pro peptidase family protein [Oscillospiraceae bacterium]
MREVFIKKLVSLMNKDGLDAVMICPSEEMKFLLGYAPMMCERFQGLFIKKDGSLFYLCNLIYTGELKNIFNDLRIISWFDGDFMDDAVSKLLESEGLSGKKIGVNTSAPAFWVLDVAKKLDITFVNARPLLEEIRIIKTDEELENLRISAAITDKVFSGVIEFIKPGMLEAEVRDFITSEMIKHGGIKPWALVASGPNSSFPHYTGGERVIESPDVVLLDFGCSYNDMCSDMSRMIFVGSATEEQKKVYDICRKATEAGEAACFEGAFIPDIDKASREVVNNAGYSDAFFTRLGHGIGFMGHEAPDIKVSNPRKLEKGMAFTVEPGINLLGKFGMRVEDVVAITENGAEILNKSTHEMIIV